ncbi:hypothetical protein DFH06DRAFT_313281 [Mycena polygramma]|nr:hypothetical protein DFH06DRAFT_546952 [Mycena polygramma]KAJ7665423.1 hypothetical protein DFH06DRAFT_313281 [Mycena polygramma]
MVNAVTYYCARRADSSRQGAAFVSSMHYSTSAFSWVHAADVEPIVENLDGMVLYRCQKCRSCAAAHMSNGNWALRGTQLERGEDEKIINWEDIKPTGHIFYGTRVVDVADNLPKWEGYQNSSNRLG